MPRELPELAEWVQRLATADESDGPKPEVSGAFESPTRTTQSLPEAEIVPPVTDSDWEPSQVRQCEITHTEMAQALATWCH